MANIVDPDRMPHSVASDLGLHCLQRPVHPNKYGYYGTLFALDIGMPHLTHIIFVKKFEKLNSFNPCHAE